MSVSCSWLGSTMLPGTVTKAYFLLYHLVETLSLCTMLLAQSCRAVEFFLPCDHHQLFSGATLWGGPVRAGFSHSNSGLLVSPGGLWHNTSGVIYCPTLPSCCLSNKRAGIFYTHLFYCWSQHALDKSALEITTLSQDAKDDFAISWYSIAPADGGSVSFYLVSCHSKWVLTWFIATHLH